MGFEMSCQGLPADCGLIDLARSDGEVAGELAFLPRMFSNAAGGELDRDGGPLGPWCRRLAALHPDLPGANCFLDRRWDMLHYLLSATRRGDPATPADLAVDRAFREGEPIAELARAGQGVPVRYLEPAEVREAAAVVGAMGHAELEARYDPARMEAGCVYKFWADRADEAEWMWILQSFDEFRDFLLRAASSGYGVIIVKD